MTTATQPAAGVRQGTYRQAINEALHIEMARDPKVFIAGVDLAERGDVFGNTLGILSKFGPERIKDTPISENAITGLATGAAAMGLRPIIGLMFVDFIGVCFDQIINQMAKMKYMFGGKATLPLTILVNSGAGGGMAAQHSQSLEALLCHIPGLKVVMPSSPADCKGLLSSSVREDNPVVFIMHKRAGITGPLPEGEYLVPLGKANIVRPGTDLTIVTYSRMVIEAQAAAEELAKQGIEVEIVDPRTLQPLDSETIFNSVRKTHRALVVHEAVQFGGLGGEIAAQIAAECFDYLDAPPLRVAAPFSPVPYSPTLEREWIPNKDDIIAAALKIVRG